MAVICQVLRCDEPAAETFPYNRPGQPLMQAQICFAHMQAIREGVAWDVDHRDRVLLMGEDLPPTVTAFSSRNDHHDRIHVDFQLGDDRSNVEIVLPRQLAIQLREHLSGWLGEE
jgi:hypothetical protein